VQEEGRSLAPEGETDDERAREGLEGLGLIAVHSDVPDHTGTGAFVRGHSSSRSREISLSRARTLLAEFRGYLPGYLPRVSIRIDRDPRSRG